MGAIISATRPSGQAVLRFAHTATHLWVSAVIRDDTPVASGPYVYQRDGIELYFAKDTSGNGVPQAATDWHVALGRDGNKEFYDGSGNPAVAFIDADLVVKATSLGADEYALVARIARGKVQPRFNTNWNNTVTSPQDTFVFWTTGTDAALVGTCAGAPLPPLPSCSTGPMGTLVFE
jgi:hypothetical protein